MKLRYLILLVSCYAAQAADWYVRPGGSGNGTSWTAAWSHTGITWANVNGGDTIWLAGGSYSGTFTIGKSGTSDAQRITIKHVLSTDTVPVNAAGYSSTYSSTVANFTAITVFGRNYVTIDGQQEYLIKITVPQSGTGVNFNDASNPSTGIQLKYIEIQGPGLVTAETDLIRALVYTGSALLPIRQFLISHCYLHDSDTLIKAENSGNMTIEYCNLYRANSGDLLNVHPDVIYAQWCDTVYLRYCNIKMSVSEGIFCDEGGCNNWYVYGNVFVKQNGTGNVIQTKQGFSWGAWYLYNNTFVDWTPGPLWRGNMVPAPVMKNNLFWNSYWQTAGDYAGAIPTYQYNGYNTSGGRFGNETSYGQGEGEIFTSVNPFSSVVSENFHLATASVWPVNNGTPLTADGFINKDMDGNIRGADGAWDMGAFEYGGTPSANPVIAISPSSLIFTPQLPGTIATNYFSVQNVGQGTLTGSNYIVGSGNGFVTLLTNYSLVAGASTNVPIRYTYGSTSPNNKNVTFTGGGGSTNNISATTSLLLGESFNAIQGNITAPYITNGGYISQSGDQTGTNDGGIAIYNFNLTNDGDYCISAVYNAASDGNNSCFIAIDAFPDDPYDIWDSVITTGFETNLVSWRGLGTFDANQFVPKIWSNLVHGVHQLYVVGREPSMQIQRFTIVSNGTSATLPSIDTQPLSRSVTEGSDVLFSVTASGTLPLSYQWRYNSTPISSATNSSYTKSNIQIAEAGSYSVIVTNIAGSVTSSNAIVTVNPAPIAPSISSQPANATVFVGGTTNFSVIASGTSPLAYQWRHAGTNLSGKTASILTLSGVTPSQAGSYVVVVTNIAGSITSSTATLTANPVPVLPYIATQPHDVNVNLGNNTNFTVAAGGDTPLSYQWRFNGTNISGATSTIYTLISVTTNNVGSYSVIIANPSGMATSITASLTVNVPPTFLAHPISVTNIQGSNQVLSCLVDGTPPFTYRWKYAGINLNDNARCSGTTTATLQISSLITNDSGSYSVVVSNVAGSTTSSSAILSVAYPPYIISQTASGSYRVVNGSNVSVTVSAGGYAPLFYRWIFNNTNNLWPGYGNTLSGTISPTDAGSYYLQVTNIAGAATSAVITISVIVPPPTPQNIMILR